MCGKPAIILIDHGHFQYNTTALGLALWAFHFMTKRNDPNNDFIYCIVGSIFFCLALNFKQMLLYHAPAVFSYLLARCLEPRKDDVQKVSFAVFCKRFCVLGGTVLLVFSSLWWPFYIYPKEGVNGVDSVTQVIIRLFPFNRGLFEGKVSNIWCALSSFPIYIRTRIAESIQPIVALILTLTLILPSCIKLFSDTKATQMKKEFFKAKEERDLRKLLLGASCSGLAFFLGSFQVHEKSILLALSPISLYFLDDPYFVSWFSFLASWTIWPLFQIDKLRSAYFISMITFGTVYSSSNMGHIEPLKIKGKGFFMFMFRVIQVSSSI